MIISEEEIKKYPNDYELGLYIRNKFYSIKENNSKYVDENGYDLCVICGKKTDYKNHQSIHERIGYVEGVGQICIIDYKKINKV